MEGLIHFHSKNSGFLVLTFISLFFPKNFITNHFCFCPLYLPFQIFPKRFFGKSYSNQRSNSFINFTDFIPVSSSSSLLAASKKFSFYQHHPVAFAKNF